MGIFKDNLVSISESKIVSYVTEANDSIDNVTAETTAEKEFESTLDSADMGSNLLSRRKILAKAAVMLSKKIEGSVVSPIVRRIMGKEYALIMGKGKAFFMSYDNQNIVIYAFNNNEEDLAKGRRADKYSTNELGLTVFFDKVLATIGIKNAVNENFKDDRVAKLLTIVPNITTLLANAPSRLGLCKQLMQNPQVDALYGGRIANLQQDIMDKIQSKPKTTATIPTNQQSTETETNTEIDDNTSGISIEVNQPITAEVEDISDKVQKAIDIVNKEYDDQLETIASTTKDMCDHVRGKSVASKRLMVICGSPGVGKTFTLEQTLKDEGMIEGKDYIKPSNFAVTPSSLYKLFYEYQDKLIILDDVSRVFDSAQKVSFWQASVHGAKGNVSKMGSMPTYKKTYNRRDNYYNEVGDVDAQLRLNSRYASLQKDYAKLSDKINSGLDSDGKYAKELEAKNRTMNDLRARIAADITPKLPDNYDFRGCVIIITNGTMASLAAEVGGDYWNSIMSRGIILNIYPNAKVVWKKIKATYQKDIDNPEVADELTIVPRERWEEVVKEVEDRLTGRVDSGNSVGFNRCDWRLLAEVGSKMRRGRPDHEWKKYLNDNMSSQVTDVNASIKQYLKYMTNF